MKSPRHFPHLAVSKGKHNIEKSATHLAPGMAKSREEGNNPAQRVQVVGVRCQWHQTRAYIQTVWQITPWCQRNDITFSQIFLVHEKCYSGGSRVVVCHSRSVSASPLPPSAAPTARTQVTHMPSTPAPLNARCFQSTSLLLQGSEPIH